MHKAVSKLKILLTDILILSYASSSIWKLYSHSNITFQLYKPAFYGGDTSIQLGLPWQSYSYQYLNTKTSAQDDRGYTTETPSISYSKHLYIRLVVTL